MPPKPPDPQTLHHLADALTRLLAKLQIAHLTLEEAATETHLTQRLLQNLQRQERYPMDFDRLLTLCSAMSLHLNMAVANLKHACERLQEIHTAIHADPPKTPDEKEPPDGHDTLVV